MCTGEVKTHLSGTAAEIEDRSITGKGAVEQPRELAPLGPSAKPFDAVARRIPGKRRALVEVAYPLGAHIACEPQIGNPIERFERCAAPRA